MSVIGPRRGELDSRARRHFLIDLRRARALVLADAEAFAEVLFAVERLGAFLVGSVSTLGKYEAALRSVVAQGITLRDCVGGHERSRFDRVFDLVRAARNDALHQGAVARHLAASCVELALMLENGLMATASKVKDLMSEGLVVARLFEPIGAVRRTMLINSFSYLPVFDEQRWQLVSDTSVVRYLRTATSSSERTRLLGTPLSTAVAHGLKLEPPAALVKRDAPLDSLLSKLDQRPILVVHGAGGVDELAGIVTPFDLL